MAGECKIPVTIIGNGSNLLVADSGIRGLVLEIGCGMGEVFTEGSTVRAQAGALLSKVAQTAANAGLSGLEFASGIPGSVGGAVTRERSLFFPRKNWSFPTVTAAFPIMDIWCWRHSFCLRQGIKKKF